MTREKGLILAELGKPYQFTTASAKAAAQKSALVRRNEALEFKNALALVEVSKVEPDAFTKEQLVRVRKQLLILHKDFVREHRRAQPRAYVIAQITASQSRLWELERKLSGIEPSSASKGSAKIEGQTVAPIV